MTNDTTKKELLTDEEKYLLEKDEEMKFLLLKSAMKAFEEENPQGEDLRRLLYRLYQWAWDMGRVLEADLRRLDKDKG